MSPAVASPTALAQAAQDPGRSRRQRRLAKLSGFPDLSGLPVLSLPRLRRLGVRRVASGTTLDYCELTDIGRRRSNNQDANAVLENVVKIETKARDFLLRGP